MMKSTRTDPGAFSYIVRSFRELGIQKPSSAPGVCGRRIFFVYNRKVLEGKKDHRNPRIESSGNLFERK